MRSRAEPKESRTCETIMCSTAATTAGNRPPTRSITTSARRTACAPRRSTSCCTASLRGWRGSSAGVRRRSSRPAESAVPILSVLVSGKPSAERTAAIGAALTELTADILRKEARLTSVAIQHVDPEHWTVGGSSLAAQRKASFFLDVRVTERTNSTNEKARYVAAVFDRMSRLLGELHEASYVHVHEVPADAWGYGGLTQADRRLAVAAA